MFIVNIQYTVPFDVIEKHLAAHRSYLDIGYKKDYLIASGPKNPRTGGILLSQLKDRQILESFLQDDPFVVNNVATFEITEFTPVKHHPQFSQFV